MINSPETEFSHDRAISEKSKSHTKTKRVDNKVEQLFSPFFFSKIKKKKKKKISLYLNLSTDETYWENKKEMLPDAPRTDKPKDQSRNEGTPFWNNSLYTLEND